MGTLAWRTVLPASDILPLPRSWLRNSGNPPSPPHHHRTIHRCSPSSARATTSCVHHHRTIHRRPPSSARTTTPCVDACPRPVPVPAMPTARGVHSLHRLHRAVAEPHLRSRCLCPRSRPSPRAPHHPRPSLAHPLRSSHHTLHPLSPPPSPNPSSLVPVLPPAS